MKEVFNLDSAIWPVDPPENLNFQGMTIWDAICQIVNQTQNCIWRDNDGNWFIASYKDNPYPFENKSTYKIGRAHV